MSLLRYGIGSGLASGAFVFNPASYGTMLAGYDTFIAAHVLNGSGVTASNNDVVDQWTDISGNGLHARQTSNPARPILKTNRVNGYSALNFPGSAAFLQLPSSHAMLQNIPGLAGCFVHKQDDTLATYCLFESEDAASNHRLRVYSTPQLSVEGHRLDADANAQLFGNNLSASAWHISIVVWNPAAGTLGAWTDSNTTSIIKNDGTGATPFSTSGGNTDNTAAAEDPVIGAASLYNVQLWKGDIAAVYFYALAGFNRTGLMSDLGTLLGVSIS